MTVFEVDLRVVIIMNKLMPTGFLIHDLIYMLEDFPINIFNWQLNLSIEKIVTNIILAV